jgi:hypothetical protein
MKKLIRTTWAVGTSIEYFKENKNKMVALGWYATDEEESCNHRYRKTKNRLLKVCYVPATSARLPRVLFFFFDVAINSTNEANKAAGMCH